MLGSDGNEANGNKQFINSTYIFPLGLSFSHSDPVRDDDVRRGFYKSNAIIQRVE